ncbi:MAG: hypothetical protein H6738_18915 [Alphaproteobacteria bacterium]|nr:hypothetical protein [Alphaproteobacteria bacterium]MCB9698860.1 hypothetical protein [Alphaproteobacteria bacterium]
MSEQEPASSNHMATASLIAGLLTWLSFLVMLCISFLPVINSLASLFYPVSFLCSLLAVVLGIVGYRQGMVTDTGRGGSILGIALGTAYILLQILLIVTLLFLFGGTLFVVLLAVLSGNS